MESKGFTVIIKREQRGADIEKMNKEENLSPKVEALYRAVMELLLEGREVGKMKVSEITGRAGIGKGTAYEYFKSREHLLMDALDYYQKSWSESIQEELSRQNGFMEKISCLFDLLDGVMTKIRKEALEEICNIFFFYPMFRRKRKGGMAERLRGIVEEGKRGGELKEEYPNEYIVLTLTGKIFNYIAYYAGMKEEEPGECTPEQIKGFLLESIRKEVVKQDGEAETEERIMRV